MPFTVPFVGTGRVGEAAGGGERPYELPSCPDSARSTAIGMASRAATTARSSRTCPRLRYAERTGHL